jgi:pimeloyl-ACP methyl ester carboxylesterase
MNFPIVEHRLELGGSQTRALELDGGGPPILLLHGFSDSADTWRLVLDRLRKRGQAAVALDMPGFGAASRLAREPELILPQLDAFVAAAAGHWATGRGVVIAGNSLGGCMALRAAQNEELPIEAVIPIAPAGLDLARWITLIQREPIVRNLLASPMPMPQAAVRAAVARAYRVMAFARPRAADPGVVAAFASHFHSKRDARRILETARRLTIEIQNPFELAKISCPAMVIWGDRDLMVPVAGAERLAEQVAGTRVEVLRGIGHCPQVEDPDSVAELMLDFLTDTGIAGGERTSAVSG